MPLRAKVLQIDNLAVGCGKNPLFAVVVEKNKMSLFQMNTDPSARKITAVGHTRVREKRIGAARSAVHLNALRAAV